MRKWTAMLLVSGCLFVLPQAVRAAEDDAKTILNRALKAHCPKGVDTKNQGAVTKSKGTVHVMGLDIDFTQEVLVKHPDKFKETSEMTVMNVKINITSVFNGKEGWLRVNDKDVAVNDDILDEFKQAAYMMALMQGMFSNDKMVKLSLVGEDKFKGKAVLGVRVAREGKKDFNLYIDKETSLIVKFEGRKKDLQSGQEVTEERIITEYQEIDGRKFAKKIEILRDRKAYMEVEVVEITPLEKVEDSEFVKPK